MRWVIKIVLLHALGLSLTACSALPSLNSNTQTQAPQTTRCCGCATMDSCQKNPDGTTCCKADSCRCKQITVK